MDEDEIRVIQWADEQKPKWIANERNFSKLIIQFAIMAFASVVALLTIPVPNNVVLLIAAMIWGNTIMAACCKAETFYCREWVEYWRAVRRDPFAILAPPPSAVERTE